MGSVLQGTVVGVRVSRSGGRDIILGIEVGDGVGVSEGGGKGWGRDFRGRVSDGEDGLGNSSGGNTGWCQSLKIWCWIIP